MENPSGFETYIEQSDIIIHCASAAKNDPEGGKMKWMSLISKVSAKSVSKKLVIFTSGSLIYGGKVDDSTEVLTEDTPTHPPPMIAWRLNVEKFVLENKDFNGVVTRPACLYGGQGS